MKEVHSLPEPPVYGARELGSLVLLTTVALAPSAVLNTENLN